MLPRTHLIKLQRALYDKLKDHARQCLGTLSPHLKRYYHEYQKDFRRYQAISNKRSLLKDLLNSQVVFCGDYHSLAQAQRTVIRLLREAVKLLKRRKRPVYLMLEMLRPSDNETARKYLDGKLSDEEFLKAIGFSRHWGFSWANYAPLFHFAREAGIGVVGINKPGASLRARDRYAARCAAQLTAKDPQAVLFMLIGDLHVAESHIPADFKKELFKRKISRKTLLIHQNNEALYWRLVEAGLEQWTEVIRLKPRVYCVMNTPPWIKLGSHLKWVEMVTEKEEADSHSVEEVWAEEHQHQAIEELDHTHEIQELVGILVRFLGMQSWAQAQAFDDFEVRGPMDIGFLNRLYREGFYNAKQIRFYALALREFESQFFPKSQTIFLTNLRLNHTASQAASYLHQKLSGFDGVFENPRRDFFRFVWVEAVAFLGSRIVNPKRHCHGPADFKRALNKAKKLSENQKAVEIALKVLELEKKGKRGLNSLAFPQRPASLKVTLRYYKAAKLLGHLLGYALYEAVLRNQASLDELRKLFSSSFTGDCLLLYLHWTARLDRSELRDVRKREWL